MNLNAQSLNSQETAPEGQSNAFKTLNSINPQDRPETQENPARNEFKDSPDKGFKEETYTKNNKELRKDFNIIAKSLNLYNERYV